MGLDLFHGPVALQKNRSNMRWMIQVLPGPLAPMVTLYGRHLFRRKCLPIHTRSLLTRHTPILPKTTSHTEKNGIGFPNFPYHLTIYHVFFRVEAPQTLSLSTWPAMPACDFASSAAVQLQLRNK
jgi:hypothetical protein